MGGLVRGVGFLLAVTVAATGCGDFVSKLGLDQNDRTSECDGFEANGQNLFTPLPPLPGNYCDAEVLHWRYDAGSEKLALLDARMLLNCCGEHSMEVDEMDGTYLVTERDSPEIMPDGSGARCGCMCVFDFAVEAGPIPEEVVHVKIIREVTDWPEGSGDVWEGDLDLTEGAGFEIIDDTPEENWCGIG